MKYDKNTPFVIISSAGTAVTAQKIVRKLNKRRTLYSHVEGEYERFPSGEVWMHVSKTVRSKDVYIMDSLSHPDPNTGIMRMLLTCNAVHLASANSLTPIILYIPYLRQDRKDQPRVPISAKAVAKLIEINMRAKRIITMDMHAEQEQGFFDIPVDNLPGRILFAEYYRETRGNDFSNVMVVAPDFGGAVRARRFAQLLGDDVSVGIIEKERMKGQKLIMHRFIGDDPKGKAVILYDDMIDTAGSIIAGARALRKRGAKTVEICATHAVFSSTEASTAEEKLRAEGIRVIVTDSIPRGKKYRKKHSDWLTVLPVDDLLVRVLEQSDSPGGSVSRLFKNRPRKSR